MAFGKLISKVGKAYKTYKKSVPAKTSLQKNSLAFKRTTDRINQIMRAPAKPKSLGTIPRGRSRDGVESAGVVKGIARAKKVNAIQNAIAGAGLVGILGGAIYGGGNKTSKPTATTPSVTTPKKKPSTPIRKTPKTNKPAAGLKKATPKTAKKKPAKKTVKMANVKTVKSRTGGSGKTQVPVGSSVIRNRDGSIKKVNKPTGKAPRSKYARMTRAEIMRLGGVEKRNYKKWKASQGK